MLLELLSYFDGRSVKLPAQRAYKACIFISCKPQNPVYAFLCLILITAEDSVISKRPGISIDDFVEEEVGIDGQWLVEEKLKIIGLEGWDVLGLSIGL